MSDAPTDAEITAAMESADLLFDDIMDDIGDDPEAAGIAYSLWVNLTRYLAECGWTSEDLARDAAHHAAHQAAEGRG